MAAKRPIPPAVFARLASCLSYEKSTGNLRWALCGRKDRIGCLAGYLQKGYRRIQFGQYVIAAHDVVWFIETGVPPQSEIDHRNLISDDNRFENLRSADRSGQGCNQKLRSDNTTGAKGVCWEKGKDRWLVQVRKDGRCVKRRFRNFDDAVSWRRLVASDLHGEFARTA